MASPFKPKPKTFQLAAYAALVFIIVVTFTVPYKAQALLPVAAIPNAVIEIAHKIGDHIENTIHIGVDTTTATSQTVETGTVVYDQTEKGTRYERLGVDAAYSVSLCSKLQGDSFWSNLLDNFGNALATTGDQTQTAGTFFISKKLTQLRAAKVCFQQLYDFSETTPLVTDRLSTALVAKRQNFLTAQTANNQRITDLEAQQTAGLKEIFKAFSMSVILELNKNLTTKVINDLKDKYKIGKYLNYADSLASQVYAIDYIQKNYEGDNQQQLIMSSLLKAQNIPGPLSNNLYYKTAQATIEAKISNTCPNAATLSAWNTQNWYQTMNNAASEGCNARLQQQKAEEQLQILMGTAKQSAAQEIQSSNGFKSTRNCTDATAQNQKIDTQYAAMDARLSKAQAAVDQAKAQLDQLYAGSYDEESAAQIEIATKAYSDAKAAYETALKAYGQLPDQVNGGVVKLCEAISSPGNFLATSINQYLGQQLQQTFDLKSDNLPLYAKILSKYTTNFITNQLLGNKSAGQILKEDAKGFLGAGLGAGVETAIEGIGGGGGGTIRVFTQYDNNADCQSVAPPGRSYKLVWNESGYSDAKSVMIEPLLLGPASLPVTGSLDVCVTMPTVYKIKVYKVAIPTASDTPIATDELPVIDPTRAVGLNRSSTSAPQVAGAQTLQPRGPKLVIR